MNRGVFLVFEGIEGSGKSTQATRIAELLEEKGLPVVQTREPGGTPIGERIRELFLSSEFQDMDPRTEALLNLAGRSQHVADVIEPALADGKTVVSDRFGDSTLAYQGGGRGLALDDLRSAHHFATAGIEPDLRILLDIDVEEGLSRRSAASATPNRIDQETLAFHRRVQQVYRDLAAADPGVWLVIDGSAPIDAVTNYILDGLRIRSDVLHGRLDSLFADVPLEGP